MRTHSPGTMSQHFQSHDDVQAVPSQTGGPKSLGGLRSGEALLGRSVHKRDAFIGRKAVPDPSPCITDPVRYHMPRTESSRCARLRPSGVTFRVDQSRAGNVPLSVESLVGLERCRV